MNLKQAILAVIQLLHFLHILPLMGKPIRWSILTWLSLQ